MPKAKAIGSFLILGFLLGTISSHAATITYFAANGASVTRTEYKALEAEKYEDLQELEYFLSAKSGWHPSSIYSGLVIISLILYYLNINLSAFFLCLFSNISLILELLFLENPFRMILPKSKSQNVYARLNSKNKKKTRKLTQKIIWIDFLQHPASQHADRLAVELQDAG